MTIDGKPFQVSVAKADGPPPPWLPLLWLLRRGPRTGSRPCARARCGPGLLPPPRRLPPLPPLPLLRAAAPAAGETAVNSPMPGSIFKVECSVGQSVKAGDVLIVLEAMKMEIEVSAPVDGTVKSIAVATGATVNTDDLLVVLG